MNNWNVCINRKLWCVLSICVYLCSTECVRNPCYIFATFSLVFGCDYQLCFMNMSWNSHFSVVVTMVKPLCSLSSNSHTVDCWVTHRGWQGLFTLNFNLTKPCQFASMPFHNNVMVIETDFTIWNMCVNNIKLIKVMML